MVLLEGSEIIQPPGAALTDTGSTVKGVNGVADPRSSLITLSARSEKSLAGQVQNLKEYLQEHQETINLDDLSYTLASKRSHFPWRSSFVAATTQSLIGSLQDAKATTAPKKTVSSTVFVFTGQGAQYFQMGSDMLMAGSNDSAFSCSIRRSDQMLKSLGADWSLVDELLADESATRLNDSRFGQPASTAIQLALVDLLESWRVQPSAVIGHSSGEIAAAYAAGAITQETAIRASYERSFLSTAAKQRNGQPGAMMVAGVGKYDADAYLAKLAVTHSDGSDLRATVACINSPLSTTMSGDESAISHLEGLLKADGIFARRLKVDTAYHSHHMQSVAPDYLERLQGLDSRAVRREVRFFSTVLGEEKHEGFGSSYWVDNLVSPVRFSDGIDCLIRGLAGSSKGTTSLDFIEIGPHGALAAPIRQCLANPPVENLSHKYITTLVRGQNSQASLLETGSSLYKAGHNLDVASVAALGRPASLRPTTLHNLPPYHWDHSKVYWNEPRLSRDYRKRTEANHDLLGLRVLTSTDSDPTWRILLSHETLPWLRDHVVDRDVIFPAYGYLAMAIEALKQLQPSSTVTGYSLKNISLKRTLLIPEETTVEAVMTFGHAETTGYTFRISSLVNGKWQENCDGRISATVKLADEVDEVEKGRVAAYADAIKVQKLMGFKARASNGVRIKPSDLYKDLARWGNKYGPSFAVVEETYVDVDGSRALCNIVVPDIAAMMPGKYQSPHTVHPTTLDATLHATVSMFQKHPISTQGAVMPVFIADVWVSAEILADPGKNLEVLCDLHTTYPNSTMWDTLVFQNGQTGSPRPVLAVTNGELRVVASADDADGSLVHATGSGGDILYKVEWGLDISSVTPADVEAADRSTPQSNEAPERLLALWNGAAVRYFGWVAQDLKAANGSLEVVNDHRSLLWAWAQDLLRSEECQAAVRAIPDDKAELSAVLSKTGVEGELVERLGSKLTDIMTGQADALSLVLDDQLLFRVYDGDGFGRGNHRLAEYVRRVTFQNPGIRILELGAGTGASTVPLLEACSPDGEHAFCSEYMYTDISSGFFETVKETKLKRWKHMLKFKTLDLELDPVGQGFEKHSYDLILASNVVHATKFLGETLANIHRLLKPGGRLGLVEVVKSQPFTNMTFGLLPGWWRGYEDGRTSGPLLSSQQWNDRLVKASFSGVEFESYDHPENAHHASFFVSTALASPSPKPNSTNGVHGHTETPVAFINALPDQHTQQQNFEAQLRQQLEINGHKTVIHDITEKTRDAGSYVLLDSATRPFLLQASAAQFDHLKEILAMENASLYWVTLPGGNEAADAPESGLVTGFSRVARSEYDSLKFFTITVQDSLGDARDVDCILKTVARLIATAENNKSTAAGYLGIEYEYTLKDGKLHIQRVAPDPNLSKLFASISGDSCGSIGDSEPCRFHQVDRPLRIKVEKPGLLTSLRYVDDDLLTTELRPDQVEVQMFAHGVNFKDQFVALGQMKATQTMCGEGAGVVVRVGSDWTSTYQPGQRVAVTFGTPYASRSITSGHWIQPIPESLSFPDAASIPVAFATAYYGLIDCAHLSKGQSVLIHAASGGLGQAAVMIAQHIGASQIFATVGSRAKKELLMNKYGIPESHIFSSRATNFRDGILHLTRGEGVDVVLNSLAGDALRATWECVAPMGTFVEVGKSDIYQRNQLDMEPFDKNIRFVAVDLVVVGNRRPALLQSVLQKVFALVNAGHLKTLPITSMPIGNIEQAFRSIQARKHTGKIVLESGSDAIVTAQKQPLKARLNGTFVIFGGLGDLGKLSCKYLQTCEVRNIALASRRTINVEEKAAIQKELSVHGSNVSIAFYQCDATIASDVTCLLEKLQKEGWPPVTGVFNMAMVLADHTLEGLTLPEFHKAVSPKYLGTRNIAGALEKAEISVDFFVNFSSVAGILGHKAQANYAAGNAFQDMFVQDQAARGRTNCFSLNMGLVHNSRLQSGDDGTVEHILARQGCGVISWPTIATALEYILSGQASRDGNFQLSLGMSAESIRRRNENNTRISPILSHLHATALLQQSLVGTAGASTKRSIEESIASAGSREDASQLILEAVGVKVAALINVDPEDIDLDVPVAQLGLDSLVAIELKNWVTRSLKAKIQNSDIIDASSLTALGDLLASRTSLLAILDVGAAEESAETVDAKGYLL